MVPVTIFLVPTSLSGTNTLGKAKNLTRSAPWAEISLWATLNAKRVKSQLSGASEYPWKGAVRPILLE